MGRTSKQMLLVGMLLVAVLALTGTVTAWANTLTNPAGASVELLTTEADSGAVVTNSAGATLEVLTTDQASADLYAPSRAWAFVGLLDSDWAGNAARLWALYD